MLVSATADSPEEALFAAVPALLAGISVFLLSLHMVTTRGGSASAFSC